MSGNFHFNPTTGRTGRCEAKLSCRFGQSEDQHGATREEARTNYEAQMAPELFANTASKTADKPVSRVPATRPLTPAQLKAQADKKELEEFLEYLQEPDPEPEPTLPATGSATAEQKVRRDAEAISNLSKFLEDSKRSSEAQKPQPKSESKPAGPILTGRPSLELSMDHYRKAEAERQLDEEAYDFKIDTRMSVKSVLKTRSVTLKDVEQAEREDGWITVKVPGGSEAHISPALARHELESE